MESYIDNRKKAPFYSIDDDKQVSWLRKQQVVIKKCLEQATILTQEIVDALYFHHDPNKKIDCIAYEMHISRSQLFYNRNKFLEAVRKELGW